MKKSDLKIKFWGVRGSYPVPDKDFLKFGGNTSCVEISAGNHRIILDCGTGIIPLGDKIFKEYISSSENVFEREKMNITAFLSHVHHDHIQGLNFFKPLNVASTSFNLFGYSGINSNINDTLSELIFGKSFPITLHDIKADCKFADVSETNAVVIKGNTAVLKRITETDDIKPENGDVVVTFMKSNSHPNYGVMCFKVSYNGKTVVYATDTECYCGGAKKLELFAKDADVLIHDSQYTTEDYLSNAMPKQGFGHSTFDMAYETAQNANVKKMVFFHFDPSYNDEKLTKLENFFKTKDKSCVLAKEGMEICL